MKSSIGAKTTASTLRPDVTYTPQKSIYPEDCDIELSMYEIEALDTEFLVVLGKPKYTYSSRGIVFVPIYFVSPKPQDPKIQIGVYEYEKDRALEMLDQDGDLDISALVPLFYPFADEWIQSHRGKVTETLSQGLRGTVEAAEEAAAAAGDAEESSSDEDEDVLKLSKTKSLRFTKTAAAPVPGTAASTPGAADQDEIFTIRHHTVPPPILPKETKEDAETIQKEYPSSPSDSWIQTFMHNPYYQIHEVEDNGDCFFAAIRDAYRSVGKETTVAKLREILAKEVTYDVFQENRQLFLDLEGSKKEYDHELKSIKDGTANLKKRFKVASSAERDLIRRELEVLTKKYTDTMEYRQNTDRILKETLGDLTDITTFDKFQDYVKTSRYWADAWAISTLEKVLNVKVIIFSEGSYQEGAIHSVLNCGEVNRDLEKRGQFAPIHYIMVTYSGIHYNLLSYKSKKMLAFSEIPYDVKTMIVNKCIEKNAGIYYMIDDFRQFKMELGIQPDVGGPEAASAADEGEGDEGSGTADEDLYDASVVFRFFAKSEKTALPGKGAGETIAKEKVVDYKDLKTVADWRRKLDDTWTLDESHPITLDGRTYASVEHYYQASKFRYEQAPPANMEFATLFTLDAGHRIGREVAVAMAAGSKSGKMKTAGEGDTKAAKPGGEVLLRPKEVKIDPEFYAGRAVTERRRALTAKFEQVPDMKRLLLMTKRAKLVHYVAKQPPEVDVPMMEVRRQLATSPAATAP